MFQFLKKLFKKVHHEHDEPQIIHIPETLNLDTYALGKTKIGQPPHPDDTFHLPDPILWIKNPEQGLELGVQNNALEFIFLTIDTYTTPIVHKGLPIILTPNITISEFTEKFGKPYFTDQDPQDTILFYEPLPGLIEIQAEFIEGKLAFLLVTSEVLMAVEEQRKAIGVDKPWPPEPSV